jgi:hypothetical protein
MESTMNSYNGYANYDTWNFVLWLGNDEFTQKAVVDAGRRIGRRWTAKAAREVAMGLIGPSTPDGAKARAVRWSEVAAAFKEWA